MTVNSRQRLPIPTTRLWPSIVVLSCVGIVAAGALALIGWIDLALSIVRPLRHGPLPSPCNNSMSPGTCRDRLADYRSSFSEAKARKLYYHVTPLHAFTRLSNPP